MGLYNHLFATHFKGSGCRLIARAYDKCRNRRVELFAIPGYHDRVGVSDGTDSWIAPATAGLFFGTSTGDCADLMRRLQAGEELGPVPDWPQVDPSLKKSARIVLDDEDIQVRPIRTRIALDDEPQPRRTSRALFA